MTRTSMVAAALGRISERWADILEKRNISVETASRLGVFTGRWDDETKQVLPSERGNILVFPYIDRGAIVAEHYRTPDKRFSQRPGGKKTFFNADVLDDPALEDGRNALVITEGEPDCLVAVDCGFPLSVSVPDGAPPERRDGEGHLRPLDPIEEQTGKFSYLWNNKDRLKRVKRITIAVDNDAPGKRLEEELVRRLGGWRCHYVEYPQGCKDLNDVRNAFGPEMVTELLNNARPYPAKGLYRMSDYRDPGPMQVYPTGMGDLVDQHIKLFPGEFIVVTGIPSDGKSTWVSNLLWNVYRVNGWRSAIFSPEMPVVPFLRDKLVRIAKGKTGIEANAFRAVDDAFVFIDNAEDAEEEDATLDWLIEKATEAVLRYGIRVMLIDPYNEVDHLRARNETQPEYIGRFIRTWKRWGQRYGVVVIVVAHPTKDVQEKGKRRTVTLYDIDGAAHWFNKCDHGIVIERPDPMKDQATIYISKVRQDGTGERGAIVQAFDRRTATYGPLDGSAAYQDQLV